MDELNPTIKERQIYHEMKLTPAMVKSIRTLCGVCLRHYVETKAFKIAIVPMIFMIALFILVPSMASSVGILVPVGALIAIGVARVMYMSFSFAFIGAL